MKTFGPYPVRFRPRPTTDGVLPELEVGFVTVEVDPIALADFLGPNALRNKTGQSKEASGRIIVRRVKQ